MKKFRGNTVLVILVAIFAVVAIAAIIVAVYFWQKSKKSENSTPAISSTTESTTQPVESPKEVVEAFMNYTIGTLPTANLDYDTARDLLTADLKVQFENDSTFSAEFYKMQEGPKSIQIISDNISGDDAAVKVNAFWDGGMGLGWAFSLVKVEGNWLISDFRNDAQ